MHISYFDENFLNHIKEKEIEPTMALTDEEIWQEGLVTYVFSAEVKGDTLILHAGAEEEVEPYVFSDIELFDDVEQVVFEHNGKQINDFELLDVDWDENIFYFCA